MTNVADIIIVGSGACGAAAAWSLSQDRSMRIVCFEQGSKQKNQYYPTKPSDFKVTNNELAYLVDPNPNIRKNFADYPIDNNNSPISIANYNGFGGSTTLYSGHFPRLHPSDFKVKTLDNIADDWPISYDELIPHFQKNEEIMEVSGLVGDTANPNYLKLKDPVPLDEVGIEMAKAFNLKKWHWWPSYSAIRKTNFLANGVDMTYWPIAHSNGVEVYTETQVSEITLDSNGIADGVIYTDKKGIENKYSANIIILACNGIGTPRLLLNSKSKLYPDGLLNENGLVGKNLMLHPLAYVEGVFDKNIDSSFGPHGCCIFSQEFYETRAENNFIRGYTMQVLRGSSAIEVANTGYFMRQLSLGQNHHKDFLKLFNHTAGIAIISEDLPEEHNRIELDYENKDGFGMPGVKIHYKMNENTQKILKHGIQMAKEIFSTVGAKVTSSFNPIRNAGWHLMGTARMGENINNSVVNKFGQAHKVKNLFIVDSSNFVTSGASNPVATSQAITLFSCDYIRKNISNLSC
ncbi:GMC family oxidoreductase [Alphaproteobacteria bacterium]|nr:GMC family oxidoreductase [Alphaproteobacteria bacterium]